MFKFVFAAIVCIAICFPAESSAQQNGLRQGPVKKLIIGLDRVKCKLGINPAKHCPKGYGTSGFGASTPVQSGFGTPVQYNSYSTPMSGPIGFASPTPAGFSNVIPSPTTQTIVSQGIQTQPQTIAAPTVTEPGQQGIIKATPISSGQSNPIQRSPIQRSPIQQSPIGSGKIINING